MTSAAIPTVTLNDGNALPVIGLGVGELSESETEQSVTAALEAGYRLIDTASAYGNEAAVGRAIASSGVPREEVFVTTKLATHDQGYQASQDALKASLERLGLDYVDLYLIHWPGGDPGKYVDSWGGLMKRKEVGDTKSIGVGELSRRGLVERHRPVVLHAGGQSDRVAPAAEPGRAARDQRRVRHRHRGLRSAGSRQVYWTIRRSDPSPAHGKTPAQVLIRWSLQLGNVVIPRSSSPERIRSNIDVFDFELTDDTWPLSTGWTTARGSARTPRPTPAPSPAAARSSESRCR